MVSIEVRSPRFDCDLNINSKCTVITGDSGIGKTELTRMLFSRSAVVKVSVSNNWDLVNLDSNKFKELCRQATKKLTGSTDSLKKYWGNEDNFPYTDSIIFIDDDDLIKLKEFNDFFHADKSNIYIIINRTAVGFLTYSVDDIYEFKSSGKYHYIERKYNITEVNSTPIDCALVEGIGSDFIFFSKLFKDNVKVLNPQYFGLQSGGKDNVIKAIESDLDFFKGHNVLVLIDYSAFGNEMQRLSEFISVNNIHIVILPSYLSFEYLLLSSNMFDVDVDKFIAENYYKYFSVESLCTELLCNITYGKSYSYSKSTSKFSECYYTNCCYDGKFVTDCDLFNKFKKKDKIIALLRDTKFQVFLNLLGI